MHEPSISILWNWSSGYNEVQRSCIVEAMPSPIYQSNHLEPLMERKPPEIPLVNMKNQDIKPWPFIKQVYGFLGTQPEKTKRPGELENESNQSALMNPTFIQRNELNQLIASNPISQKPNRSQKDPSNNSHRENSDELQEKATSVANLIHHLN